MKYNNEDLRKKKFDGQKIEDCEFKSCNLEGVNFSNFHFSDTTFINCNFKGCDFSNTSLNNVNFIDSSVGVSISKLFEILFLSFIQIFCALIEILSSSTPSFFSANIDHQNLRGILYFVLICLLGICASISLCYFIYTEYLIHESFFRFSMVAEESLLVLSIFTIFKSFSNVISKTSKYINTSFCNATFANVEFKNIIFGDTDFSGANINEASLINSIVKNISS